MRCARLAVWRSGWVVERRFVDLVGSGGAGGFATGKLSGGSAATWIKSLGPGLRRDDEE
jgi:hypothetical protein